ncbi:MAG: DNA-binding protein [Clostridium sp.]
MALRESKTRYPLSIRKDLKEELEEIAKKKDISLNSLIISIIEEYSKKEAGQE